MAGDHLTATNWHPCQPSMFSHWTLNTIAFNTSISRSDFRHFYHVYYFVELFSAENPNKSELLALSQFIELRNKTSIFSG